MTATWNPACPCQLTRCHKFSVHLESTVILDLEFGSFTTDEDLRRCLVALQCCLGFAGANAERLRCLFTQWGDRDHLRQLGGFISGLPIQPRMLSFEYVNGLPPNIDLSAFRYSGLIEVTGLDDQLYDVDGVLACAANEVQFRLNVTGGKWWIDQWWIDKFRIEEDSVKRQLIRRFKEVAPPQINKIGLYVNLRDYGHTRHRFLCQGLLRSMRLNRIYWALHALDLSCVRASSSCSEKPVFALMPSILAMAGMDGPEVDEVQNGVLGGAVHGLRMEGKFIVGRALYRQALTSWKQQRQAEQNGNSARRSRLRAKASPIATASDRSAAAPTGASAGESV